MNFTPKDILRFWRKVNKNGPIVRDELGPCWVWTEDVSKPMGYGRFYAGGAVNGAKFRSHRVSFFLANGAFDESLCVLHKCDNAPCVRPDHLFLGTRAENIQDMIQKGRQWGGESRSLKMKEVVAKGQDVNGSKLKNEQVLEIREIYSFKSASMQALARRFGVSIGLIHGIIHRTKWAHI